MKFEFEEDAPPGFLARHKWIFISLGLGVVGYGTYVLARATSKPLGNARPAEEITMVSLPPPPVTPPPPPPPPQQEEEEEEMVKEENPEEAPPEEAAPADDPPATANVGNGPNSFGLKAGKGGGGMKIKARTSNRTKWGWYAGKIQTRIAEALRNSPVTKNASISVEVRIWPDTSGRIIKANIRSGTGNAAMDQNITNNILTGMMLAEAPPADMPLPINLKITAQRPR